MRSTYLNTLYELAQKDDRIVSLVADNGLIVYDDFRRDFPERYFNFGIAEGNMVAAAAGLASCGMIPYCYTINAFLAYRSYEFIRDDVCFQNQNVKIVGIGTGLAYSTLGPSHHTTEDIALLRSLPNLTVFSPATRSEVKWMMKKSYEIEGPVYIRLGNNKEEFYESEPNFVLGEPTIVKQGTDITIMTTGPILNEVMLASDLLLKEGINAEVVSVHTLKPLNNKVLTDMATATGKLVVVEEHNIIGGLYAAIAEALLECKEAVPILKIGLQDKFATGYGTLEEVRAANELDYNSIYQKIMKFISLTSMKG